MISDPPLRFRRATKADLSAVEDFLTATERPVGGVADQLERFWLAAHGNQIIGCAGLEKYGAIALLRSVAVLPERRNQGIGKALFSHIMQDAMRAKITDLYLLTTHAQRYFEGFGFRALDRSAAPRALLASAEFQGACPESATLMRLSLAAPPTDTRSRGPGA